jgi:hypothetical protein
MIHMVKKIGMNNLYIEMMIKHFETYILERKINYQKSLNPDFWEDDVFVDRIRKKLLRISRDFYKELELETEIVDICLTGSLANYNYMESSDIDVHILIDFTEINEDTDLVKQAIDGQRFIWNLRHDVIIKGHEVELYIQDSNEKHRSTGVYSLLNEKWIVKPKYNPPDVDTEDVDEKYERYESDIKRLENLSKEKLEPEESEKYYEYCKELKRKIMKSRRDALDTEGEFSIENLVFKKLRNEGMIERLIDVTTEFYDKIYSQ